MPVIQCPGCQKKLKLKALKEGAKVKCPGCDQIFRPKASGSATAEPAKRRSSAAGNERPLKKRPAKKKRPAPVDDYDDFGSEDFGDDYGDDFGEPAPRRPRSGGKKAAKKKPVEKKSKLPLIIGLAVVAVAAIGGGAFWLLGGGSDDGGNEANVADSDSGNADSDSGNPNGNDAGDTKPAQSKPASVAANTNQKAGNSNAARPTVSGTADVGAFDTAASPVDLKWMPASTEGLLHIKMPELMKGPIGALIQSPQLAPQLEQVKAMAGFGPENIDSITVGISRISEMSQQQKEPDPESLSVIAVIRANQSVDPSKLTAISPQANQVTEGSLTYYLIPEDPPVAIWMPDDRTAVVGAESIVKQVAKGDSSTSNLDPGLLNGQSSIEIAFSPAIPDAIFRHRNFRIPDGGPAPVPPPIRTLVASMKENTVGMSIGITLTEDLGISTTFRSRDAAGAAKFQRTFQSVFNELKDMPDASAGGQGIPPQMQMMMAPFKQISDDMNDSFSVTTAGTLTSSTMEAKRGGKTISGFVPLAAMTMLPAIQAGRTAARATQGRNNMKQIALAMFNFHDVYGRFPNAIGKGPNGEEWLSWRVHLLPFLGHVELYEQFALEEPWDSPTNLPLVSKMPNVYRSPQVSVSGGKTVYQVPVGPGAIFEGSVGRSMRDITDGTSNTILLVEVEMPRAVEWTRPMDYSFTVSDPLEGLLAAREAGYQVAYADGSTQTIAPSTSPESANAMFTRAGGELPNQ